MRVGGVNPVVRPVARPVDAKLRIRRRETGQDNLANIGPAVSIRVFEVQDVRRGRHQNPVAPAHDAVREIEPVREDSTCFVVAVSVPVIQQLDLAERPHVERVIAHLDDVDACLLVERDGHRIDDFGFRGNEFDAEPLGELEGLQCLFGRKGRAVERAPRESQKRNDTESAPDSEAGRRRFPAIRPAILGTADDRPNGGRISSRFHR